MLKLGVNIDHVATIRNARGGAEPEPVAAAAIAELAGADSITIHLREDRRHIKDRDVLLLKSTLQTRMNLEMAVTEEMQRIALETMPYSCCLVPEKREEVTTEGGLDVAGQLDKITEFIKPLIENGIIISLFVDPNLQQIEAAAKTGAQYIELHTGQYSEVFNTIEEDAALKNLQEAAVLADELGLKVNAGHGLNYHNVSRMLEIKQLEELNIGHSIISKSIFIGLDNAVRDMKSLLK